MSSSYKVLYQGQLPSSIGVLVTVPALKQWIVKSFENVNNDVSPRTFSLYQNGTTASHIITSTAVSIPAGGSWQRNCDMTFNAGDTIAGVASVSGQLTFTVWGSEIG